MGAGDIRKSARRFRLRHSTPDRLSKGKLVVSCCEIHGLRYRQKQWTSGSGAVIGIGRDLGQAGARKATTTTVTAITTPVKRREDGHGRSTRWQHAELVRSWREAHSGPWSEINSVPTLAVRRKKWTTVAD